MICRHDDGSAGDANYGVIGAGYARYRRPDPRLAEFIRRALRDAMPAQRPAHLPLAIGAVAEQLPFEGESFDASMATFTVHQWPDMKAGLAEMRRVTRGSVLILTGDPDELDRFWLHSYAPEVLAVEADRCPRIEAITQALGNNTGKGLGRRSQN